MKKTLLFFTIILFSTNFILAQQVKYSKVEIYGNENTVSTLFQ